MKYSDVDFVCSVCRSVVHSRFVPSKPPKCPSCGAETVRAPQDSHEGQTPAIRAFCTTCHFESDLHQSDACPRCGSDWGNFAGIRSDNDTIPPDIVPETIKRGASGGI